LFSLFISLFTFVPYFLFLSFFFLSFFPNFLSFILYFLIFFLSLFFLSFLSFFLYFLSFSFPYFLSFFPFSFLVFFLSFFPYFLTLIIFFPFFLIFFLSLLIFVFFLSFLITFFPYFFCLFLFSFFLSFLSFLPYFLSYLIYLFSFFIYFPICFLPLFFLSFLIFISFLSFFLPLFSFFFRFLIFFLYFLLFFISFYSLFSFFISFLSLFLSLPFFLLYLFPYLLSSLIFSFFPYFLSFFIPHSLSFFLISLFPYFLYFLLYFLIFFLYLFPYFLSSLFSSSSCIIVSTEGSPVTVQFTVTDSRPITWWKRRSSVPFIENILYTRWYRAGGCSGTHNGFDPIYLRFECCNSGQFIGYPGALFVSACEFRFMSIVDSTPVLPMSCFLHHLLPSSVSVGRWIMLATNVSELRPFGPLGTQGFVQHLHLTLFSSPLLAPLNVLPHFPASSRTVLFPVCFSLPLLQDSCGFQSNACLSTDLSRFLRVRPIRPHFLIPVCNIIDFCPAASHNSVLLIVWYHLTAFILHKHRLTFKNRASYI